MKNTFLKFGKVKLMTLDAKKYVNIELLLQRVYYSFYYSLKRNDHDDITLKMKTDPEEFIQYQ